MNYQSVKMNFMKAPRWMQCGAIVAGSVFAGWTLYKAGLLLDVLSVKIPKHDPRKKIEDEGGRWVKAKDGRIIEYWVCGSDRKDARVLLDCHGGGNSGKFFSTIPSWVAKAKELNIKVISPTQPGYGLSTIQPGRVIANWPRDDVALVLDKEAVDKFIVHGASLGTPHAMACAIYFGPDRVTAVGLRVPFIGLPYSQKFGLALGQETFGQTENINGSVLGNITARFIAHVTRDSSSWIRGEPNWLLKTCMAWVRPDELAQAQYMHTQHQTLMDALADDMQRGSGGDRSVGMAFNVTNDVLLHHGFDPREMKVKKVLVWYAADDKDCPPTHGAWLSQYYGCWKTGSVRTFLGGHLSGSMVEQEQYLDKLMSL